MSEEIGHSGRDRDRDIEREEYRYIDIDISTQGRPRQHSDEKHKRLVQVYVNRQGQLLYENLKEILKREKRSFSSWVMENVESYIRLHEPGNPQQRLDTILRLGKAYHAPSRVCGFKDCLRDAVAVGVFVQNGREYGLCPKHLKEAKDCKGSWKFL